MLDQQLGCDASRPYNWMEAHARPPYRAPLICQLHDQPQKIFQEGAGRRDARWLPVPHLRRRLLAHVAVGDELHVWVALLDGIKEGQIIGCVERLVTILRKSTCVSLCAQRLGSCSSQYFTVPCQCTALRAQYKAAESCSVVMMMSESSWSSTATCHLPWLKQRNIKAITSFPTPM